eukprot:scaffold1229_cov400-Prasinococcus_capsulatus_cf.AAC.1
MVRGGGPAPGAAAPADPIAVRAPRGRVGGRARPSEDSYPLARRPIGRSHRLARRSAKAHTTSLSPPARGCRSPHPPAGPCFASPPPACPAVRAGGEG